MTDGSQVPGFQKQKRSFPGTYVEIYRIELIYSCRFFNKQYSVNQKNRY